MKISKDNNITYTGLSRSLGKGIYSQYYINYLDTLYKNSQGIVGNLPPRWINNMPKNEREKNIKNLYKNIGLIFKHFKSNFIKSKLITLALRRSKAIAKDERIKLEYINSGAYGSGYKMTTNKLDIKPLFLKQFKEGTFPGWHRHGIMCEANTKEFLKKNLKTKNDKKCFPDFYYADLKNGYYIEEFVDGYTEFFDYSINKSINKISNILEKFGLLHNDLHKNNYKMVSKKSGRYPVCFDLGGVVEHKY